MSMKTPLLREPMAECTIVLPLNQSRYCDMGCETPNVRKHVKCTKIADSAPAARGTEIHQILATYINHLVGTKHSTDLETYSYYLFTG